MQKFKNPPLRDRINTLLETVTGWTRTIIAPLGHVTFSPIMLLIVMVLVSAYLLIRIVS